MIMVKSAHKRGNELRRNDKMLEKIRAANRCTRLTDAEVSDLKAATGKGTIEAALQDAAEYRIMHPMKKKVN